MFREGEEAVYVATFKEELVAKVRSAPASRTTIGPQSNRRGWPPAIYLPDGHSNVDRAAQIHPGIRGRGQPLR